MERIFFEFVLDGLPYGDKFFQETRGIILTDEIADRITMEPLRVMDKIPFFCEIIDIRPRIHVKNDRVAKDAFL
ncbi:MAG: hypothetical protein PHH96_09665, partial [Smithellaceae bacterium]|nr:hypothetical protein [Smithellaceae bacterium]